MTLSEDYVSNAPISLSELSSRTTNEFLKPFEAVLESDIHNGMDLDFELSDREYKNKINPILRLAVPEDAKEIVRIYKELYDGTYPYKEMEDVNEVQKMIQDPSIQWIIFQDRSFNIAGCITFVLDFNNKRGYIRGFMLKKKYQRYINITKAMIGSMVAMIHKYLDMIFVWYVENRTAHAKSQYSMWVCGIAPIGFFPNKDVFLGKVESDLMQICYDERTLNKLRKKEVPIIIPQAQRCYAYSDERYRLGEILVKSPDIFLDDKKISSLKQNLKISTIKDKYDYETITFSFTGSDAYFEFLYTPQVQNFEKTKYRVNNLEELYIFVKKFIKLGKERRIRYSEAFISAYKPTHQKIFHSVGFSPRGYIPSWKYNEGTQEFEDYILFNKFKGSISKNIKLIEEGKQLLHYLDFETVQTYEEIFEEKNVLCKIPAFSSVKKEKLSLHNPPKILKISILTGLALYLCMLLGSVSISNVFGYEIISHTISQLGAIATTPIPLIFDSACVVGGLTSILFFDILSRKIQFMDNTLITSKVIVIAKWFGIMGSIGTVTLGIFSMDRSGPQGIYHVISSLCAFSGYVLALFVFGVIILNSKSTLLKIIGINATLPCIILIVAFIFPCPLLEWMLLFSILESLIPFFGWVLSN